MSLKPRQYEFPEFDDNDLSPSGRPASKLWGGIIAPIVVALDGLYSVIVRKSFSFGLRYPQPEFEGMGAIYWGIGLLFVAAFLHFHFYWTVSEKLWKYSGLLKIISILGIVIMYLLAFRQTMSS